VNKHNLWRFHLVAGLLIALAYVYVPMPAVHPVTMALLCTGATLAPLIYLRLWRPTGRLVFYLAALAEGLGFISNLLPAI
jgi:hypothetical protein